MNVRVVFGFACLLHSSVQFIDGETKSYKAAVVEYNPSFLTAINIKHYQKFIEDAENKADIILFPEGTLSILSPSLIPKPEDNIIPYLNKTYGAYEPVHTMSEAAAKHKVYVVVNLQERAECTNSTKDCPARGYFLYNTNVAFDRKGTVIARYRKINLYGEDTDKPEQEELSTFTTDFGVTFGMVICFDILFKTPAIDLVRQKNVTNILFSTFWFGQLPFLTASQMQAGYSYVMNVTLLAAGANMPFIGSTGSGMYLGRGKTYRAMREKVMDVQSYFMPPVQASQGESEVLHYRQINRNLGRVLSMLRLKSDPSIQWSIGEDLDMKAGVFESEICEKELCCKFSAKYRNSTIPNRNNYKYRAVAYQGTTCYSIDNWYDVTYCSVVLCIGNKCAEKPLNDNYPLIFDDIKIEGQFKGKNTFHMPTTLVYREEKSEYTLLDTLDNDCFTFNRQELNGVDSANVSINLLKGNVGNLITFGIFGRIFQDKL